MNCFISPLDAYLRLYRTVRLRKIRHFLKIFTVQPTGSDQKPLASSTSFTMVVMKHDRAGQT